MRKVSLAAIAKVFILAVILVSGILATSANAAVDPTATALLFTYYDVRSLSDGGLGVTDNYFTVINSSSAWTQAHVRVRTGDCSVELLDFDIMLSPNDVFAFDLSQDGDGIAFSSKDAVTIANSKELAPFLQTLPDGSDGIAFSSNPSSPFYTPNLTSLILTCGTCPNRTAITEADANRATLKGYVEVIEEGQIVDCAATASHVSSPSDAKHGYCRPTDEIGQYLAGVTCSSPVENLVDITEHTLYELASNFTDPVAGLCDLSVERIDPALDGRVYYASVSPDFTSVPRLAHINAEGMASIIGRPKYATDKSLILHANTYTDELAAPRCLAGNGQESCFAYSEATTNGSGELDDASVGGANDMNYCFYQDLVTGGADDGLGVKNKFGAGATFGPTIADLSYQGRSGFLFATTRNLINFLSYSSVGSYPFLGLNSGLGIGGPFLSFLRNEVHSHFFFSPAPADFDIKTALAFIFPVKHFINEKPQLGKIVYYNMDEEPCTAPSGGFISPGLPGQLETTEEAFLEYLTANCGYAEGWVHIGEISAKNETQIDGHCTLPGLPRVGNQLPKDACEVFNFVTSSTSPNADSAYTPAVTGAVNVIGGDSHAASLLHFHGEGPVCVINYDGTVLFCGSPQQVWFQFLFDIANID